MHPPYSFINLAEGLCYTLPTIVRLHIDPANSFPSLEAISLCPDYDQLHLVRRFNVGLGLDQRPEHLDLARS